MRLINIEPLETGYEDENVTVRIRIESEHWMCERDTCTIPTIDAVPVVHGRWAEKGWGYECSACDCCEDVPRNYCPNCGAKMDGGII